MRGGDVFLSKIFSPHELSSHTSTESRAGVFAAKESIIKALRLPGGSWHKIEIRSEDNGRPVMTLEEHDIAIKSLDISISHDGEYAMAVVAFIL